MSAVTSCTKSTKSRPKFFSAVKKAIRFLWLISKFNSLAIFQQDFESWDSASFTSFFVKAKPYTEKRRELNLISFSDRRDLQEDDVIFPSDDVSPVLTSAKKLLQYDMRRRKATAIVLLGVIGAEFQTEVEVYSKRDQGKAGSNPRASLGRSQSKSPVELSAFIHQTGLKRVVWYPAIFNNQCALRARGTSCNINITSPTALARFSPLSGRSWQLSLGVIKFDSTRVRCYSIVLFTVAPIAVFGR